MANLEQKLSSDMANLEQKVSSDIANLEQKIEATIQKALNKNMMTLIVVIGAFLTLSRLAISLDTFCSRWLKFCSK
jgi:3-dehydroquinate dehydratase